jgi:hypothetical protein
MTGYAPPTRLQAGGLGVFRLAQRLDHAPLQQLQLLLLGGLLGLAPAIAALMEWANLRQAGLR